jgi:hypothetical protein
MRYGLDTAPPGGQGNHMNTRPDDDGNEDPDLVQPARTDHPVGEDQAAENREEEPPA